MSIPAKPGHPARHDYEYERNGTVNLFMMFAPLEGWRHVEVTDRHTAVDYARILKDLSDRHFRDSKKVALIQDNLNIHKPASLYEAFPAPEARRLGGRFEWHYTPKYGSWLDMAESELSVLSGPPSVPMRMRHQTPGNLDLRVRKDHHAHAHAPATDRCRGGRRRERRP